MEEKELLQLQIRLLQGLIDDYKNLHGNTPAPGPSASCRWQPPVYNSSRAFGAPYPRPSRKGFSMSHGPAWRKKYSLLNRPPGPLDPPGDCAAHPTLGAGGSQDPHPQQYVLERQVQLSADQSMVITIKPPSQPSRAGAAGVPRGSSKEYEDPPWSDLRPLGGEGEPPGGQHPPSKPGRAQGADSTEDCQLVCQKEAGKPRVVKSVSSLSDSLSESRRTVSESAISVALTLKVSAHPVAGCAAQLLGDRRADRAAAENVCTAERDEKLPPRAEPETKPKKPAVCPAGALRSQYQWKASSPSASSCSSFRWQSEAGSKDHAFQLSPVPSMSSPGDKPAVGPSGLKPLFSETPGLWAYKVKSPTKIVKRRGSANLPGDKKSSPPPTATAKSQFSLRRRQALRGRSGPVQKKTVPKGLMQVTRHRLCCLPPGRAHLPIKEASNLNALQAPATSKVIKTRYPIVKKTPEWPFSASPFPLSLPSWRARRISLSRSLVLNRLRPALGRVQLGSPRWRDRGYRCIGGVLYQVTANKLAKTPGRPSAEGACRPLLRTGRLDPPGSCSRSLASRAVQRSLAVVWQARQGQEYCMYYNRFGRCNRGERCPYIHDPENPEKVAVCTRFLRGTCKKMDRTCPFSHQVSKEKMPVCSYFLKGICSNSDCPYSHVYVSRKAEVCTDFLKGYCPLGTKCKKKHTLLCPDFSHRGSCPRGAQCQLLHRNQKRPGRQASAPPAPEPSSAPPRSRASTGHGPRKPSASQRPARQTPSSPTSEAAGQAFPLSSAAACPLPSKTPFSPSPSSPTLSSPSPSLDQEEPMLQEEAASAGKGSRGLSKLPSFISLQSTPSPGGQPRAPTTRSAPAKDSGKPLHIKPRL
ncbi:zinc finger CCCH domain-containing protein 3 [Myotis lucifugus]|uniref:zinc finger CCCH domain-containing protein 3 n=1 Tax=Myotis lucifugus TaxID=59463 RepID=UPI0003C46D40|nr:zinc finger CCCH domain-containing protein 3 [Myotis lucifugus]